MVHRLGEACAFLHYDESEAKMSWRDEHANASGTTHGEPRDEKDATASPRAPKFEDVLRAIASHAEADRFVDVREIAPQLKRERAVVEGAMIELHHRGLVQLYKTARSIGARLTPEGQRALDGENR